MFKDSPNKASTICYSRREFKMTNSKWRKRFKNITVRGRRRAEHSLIRRELELA